MGRSVTDPVFDASVNVVGGLGLLDCCRRFGVRRIIYSSSGGAGYGDTDVIPTPETHPTLPISPYGITKVAMEYYVNAWGGIFGISGVSLRYANIYGPRQNPEGEAGVVAIFTNRMLAGQQPVINGDGGQTRDYVFVGDVVRANVLALGFRGSDSFNVGTGVESDVNTLFRILKQKTRASCPEQHGPPKAGEQLRSVLENRKIRETLGWTPEVTLEQGLSRTVDSFREAARDAAPAH